MTVLSCVSLVSPVGYGAAATCAALRAGIAAFEELDYPDSNDTPLRGARIDAIAPAKRGRERLIALAQLTMEHIDTEVAVELPWSQMPIILCTRDRDVPGARLNGILSGLRLPDGSMLGQRRTAHVAAGQTSAFAALRQAREMLGEGNEPACLLLALDSLIDARTLAWLDSRMRLKTSAVTDGLIPGEAACLAVVSREPLTPHFVVVRGLGFGSEMATAVNEEPFRADGLRAALRNALAEAGTEMHEVAFRLSDVAGESYAFEELVLAQIRNMRNTRHDQPLWHAADCIGDTGAAAGLIQFAWAEQAFHRGYAPGDLAALHGSSMAFSGRAAAVISGVIATP
jgi:3-oxoacyl-[acyl-carrier-protein] synthase I